MREMATDGPAAGRPTARHRMRALWLRRRRGVAALLAAGAVATGLGALQPPPPDRVAVLAAARDLPGGTRLERGQVTTVRLRPGVVPDGALRPEARVSGRTLAAPMRAREPFTDAAFLRASLTGDQDLVATPVRVADAGAARLLRSGDRIDVLAARTREAALAEPASVLAEGVRVLGVPGRPHDRRRIGGAGPEAGALVLLATTAEQARSLASAAVNARLSITLRRG